MNASALAPEADTPLGRRLAADIAENGSMRLDRFMEACLSDPSDGYYTTRDALGAAGDFTTAPEISQIFGELLGLWAAQCWMDRGGPGAVALAEIGPGRGVLMADMLRAARAAPAFRAALTPWLVEMSPKLRAEQAERLADEDANWRETPDALPTDRPLFLVSNEFLDALPIRQWRRVAGAWRESVVRIEGGRFAIVPEGGGLEDAADIDGEAHADRFPDAPEGAFLEMRPDDSGVVAALSERLAAQGGAALFIDYGYDDAARRRAGGRETLQALYDKRPCAPADWPGQADLTAHVNFDDLVALLPEELVAYGPLAQGAFLLRLGAEARAAQLIAAQPTRAEEIASGLRRLTDGAEMGQLFKVVAISRRTDPPPPGFEGLPARSAASVRRRSE